MALDRLEKASLNRLRQNVLPIDNKIKRIEKKVADFITKAREEITELEKQKEIYLPMIQHLEAKEKEEEVAEVEAKEVDNDSFGEVVEELPLTGDATNATPSFSVDPEDEVPFA